VFLIGKPKERVELVGSFSESGCVAGDSVSVGEADEACPALLALVAVDLVSRSGDSRDAGDGPGREPVRDEQSGCEQQAEGARDADHRVKR
jgi:hypothetical protein